jgi:hypothetical protein
MEIITTFVMWIAILFVMPVTYCCCILLSV